MAPVAYSVAAQSTPTRSGEANSITWVARYSAFLIGPLAVGFIGDQAGLRVALSLFIVTSPAIAALAYAKWKMSRSLRRGWSGIHRVESPWVVERLLI